jgi:hypothetical protein
MGRNPEDHSLSSSDRVAVRLTVAVRIESL